MAIRYLTEKQAIRAIEEKGILLTYPIDNRAEPESLWSVAYPGTEMRWEWDSNGDERVSKLWHLKTELSSSRSVVYAKWFRGRATFFSKETFISLLAASRVSQDRKSIRNREARQIMEVLEMNSPISTKELKTATELRGKALTSTYEKAMKELWTDFRIVGFGEVEDGAFPSLAIGATSMLFEDLWEESKTRSPEKSLSSLRDRLGEDSLFYRFLLKNLPRD